MKNEDFESQDEVFQRIKSELEPLKPAFDKMMPTLQWICGSFKDAIAPKKNHFKGYRKPTEREHRYIRRILAGYDTISTVMLTLGTMMLVLLVGMIAHMFNGEITLEKITMIVVFFIMFIALGLYGKHQIGMLIKIRKGDYEVLEGTAVYTFCYVESRNRYRETTSSYDHWVEKFVSVMGEYYEYGTRVPKYARIMLKSNMEKDFPVLFVRVNGKVENAFPDWERIKKDPYYLDYRCQYSRYEY